MIGVYSTFSHCYDSGMSETLPTSACFVKNGAKGKWWLAVRDYNQIHLRWHSTQRELILKPDFEAIEKLTRQEFGEKRGAATTDIQQLKDLLDGPSQHIEGRKESHWW